MKKTKGKISAYRIAFVVIAFFLAVNVFLNFSGAWFTDKVNQTGNTVVMKFGTVKINEVVMRTTVNNMTETYNGYQKIGDVADDGYLESGAQGYDSELHEVFDYPDNSPRSNAQTEEGAYLLTAGTRVVSTIRLDNISNVDVYYIMQTGTGADARYFVIDPTNKCLLEVHNGAEYNNALALALLPANNNDVELTVKFTLKEDAYGNDHGHGVNGGGSGYASDAQAEDKTAENDIWLLDLDDAETANVVEGMPAAQYASFLADTNVTHKVTYGGTVNLGTYLFNQAFSIRIIQRANINAATVTGANNQSNTLGGALFALLTDTEMPAPSNP